MTKWVRHDELLWKVTGETELDEKPAYTLLRRIPVHLDGKVVSFEQQKIVAFVNDCEPHSPTPKRVIRSGDHVLTFNVSLGTITIKERGRKTGHDATLKGLYQALSWQAARIKRNEREFKRRTRRR